MRVGDTNGDTVVGSLVGDNEGIAVETLVVAGDGTGLGARVGSAVETVALVGAGAGVGLGANVGAIVPLVGAGEGGELGANEGAIVPAVGPMVVGAAEGSWGSASLRASNLRDLLAVE